MASLGTVFVDFIARTAGFQQGVQQAAESVKQGGKQMQEANAAAAASADKMVGGMEKGFLRIAVGAHVFTLIRDEIKHVIENIDKIPGVPAETITSVNTLKQSMSEARAVLDGWIASAVSGFAMFGQAVGVTAARIANGISGTETDYSGLSKQNTPDEDARLKDPKFDDKIKAAVDKMTEARFKASVAAMTEGAQINALQEKAERYEKFAKSSSINTVERLDAEAKAFELTGQANTKYKNLQEQLAKSLEAVGKSQDRLNAGRQSAALTLDQLKKREGEIYYQMGQLSTSGLSETVQTERRIALNKQLATTLGQIATATEKLQAPFNKIIGLVGDNLAQAFIDVASGAKNSFADLGRMVLKEIEKIVVRLLIVKPLFQSLGSAFSSGGSGGIWGAIGGAFTSYAGAMAGGGNIGGGEFALVGENGPELLANPGTVISNDKIASAMGSGGGRAGNVYQIDARGADAGVVQRLQAALVALAGPGVVERRALNAYSNRSVRRAA